MFLVEGIKTFVDKKKKIKRYLYQLIKNETEKLNQMRFITCWVNN